MKDIHAQKKKKTNHRHSQKLCAVILETISTDFDDVIYSSDFYSQISYYECEVPIPDVTLCLCVDMRLRGQCYQNGGAHGGIQGCEWEFKKRAEIVLKTQKMA